MQTCLARDATDFPWSQGKGRGRQGEVPRCRWSRDWNCSWQEEANPNTGGRDFLRGTATFNVGIWNTCRKIERASQSAIYAWYWVADEMIGSVKSSCCSPGSSGRPVRGEFHVVACMLLKVSKATQKKLPVTLSHLQVSSSDRWVAITSQIRTVSVFILRLFLTASGPWPMVIDWVFFRTVLRLLTRSVKSGSSILKHLQVSLAQRESREPTHNEQQMHLRILDHIVEVWTFFMIISSVSTFRRALDGTIDRSPKTWQLSGEAVDRNGSERSFQRDMKSFC